MSEECPKFTIYADGACSQNPGPGGYGAVLVAGEQREELSAGFRKTTNNRMELRGVIEALRRLSADRTSALVHSDSRYIVDMVNDGHATRWRAHGWMRNQRDRAENSDLWETLLSLCDRHNVTFVWVKGHAGHSENERCDELAVHAREQEDLPPDEGYETMLSQQPKQLQFDL